jgi:hypothetical protein
MIMIFIYKKLIKYKIYFHILLKPMNSIMFILSKYFKKPIWYSEWMQSILNEILLNYCFYKSIELEQIEQINQINNDIGYNIDMETDIVLYDMHKTPSFEMPTDYIITINDSYNQYMDCRAPIETTVNPERA